MPKKLEKKIFITVPYEDVDPRLNVKRKVIYPLEPATVVAVLLDNDFTVDGIDLNLAFKSEQQAMELLQNKVVRFNPDIVLVMSQHLTFLIKEQHRIIRKMIKAVDEAVGNKPLVISGTTPSLYPETFFNITSPPPIVFKGEIEDKIIEIINNIHNKGHLKTIRGVCSTDNDNASQANYVEDLSTLPRPDRDVFPLKHYFDHPERGNLRYPEKSRRFTQIAATRGCNTGCTFCKVKNLRGKYRWRDIDAVIEEIAFLINDRGIREIHFLDENLLLNKPKAQRLFQRIVDENLEFSWFCGGGMAVYMLDEKLLALMRNSGCYRLHLAVESGSQRILSDIMKKPIHIEKALNLIEYAKSLDFEIIGYFMIGLPTETKAEVLKTVELARNPAFDYVVFSIYTPEIGTELYDYCLERQLLDESRPLFDLSKRAASNLRYQDYDQDFLMDIRKNVWQEINFNHPTRKKKIEKMFGGAVND